MYKVVEIPGKGRGLVAISDIKKGTAILVEDPYASSIQTSVAEHRSFHSFLPSETLLRCAGCKLAK